jgi:hypothetical protein
VFGGPGRAPGFFPNLPGELFDLVQTFLRCAGGRLRIVSEGGKGMLVPGRFLRADQELQEQVAFFAPSVSVRKRSNRIFGSAVVPVVVVVLPIECLDAPAAGKAAGKRRVAPIRG